MSAPGCQVVNIEGMRVLADHVMIELCLPVGKLHAGEVGDPGFRASEHDIYGLPRAENSEDWENTEASLKARLGPEYDRLADFEKKVLLRGTPLGHGRYTFLLKVKSTGKTDRPEVTVADLKKLGKFSPRAHVYADPVSGDRVFRTYLPDSGQLNYRSVLGTPVAFNAKKARGGAGRPGKHPGKVWDVARENPEVLVMLLEGISPGSSNKIARIKGTRRANAQQLAWILQTPGAAHCVYDALTSAYETTHNWVTDDDVAWMSKQIESGTDGRHFENDFERYFTQDRDLDKALRLVRGFADLSETDPDVLRGFLEGRTPEQSAALQLALAESSRLQVLPGTTDASLTLSASRYLLGMPRDNLDQLRAEVAAAWDIDYSRVRRSPITMRSGATTSQANTGESLIAIAAALGYISTQQTENLISLATRALLQRQYIFGDVGPAGGIIFSVESGIYLEAAPEDIGEFKWKEATSAADTYSIAANDTTYNDWRLPSKSELNAMYKNRNLIKGFSTGGYWSSSEYGADIAWAQGFDTGFQGHPSKFNTFYVRPVRAFSI